MKVFGVIGWKNSGKTTLTERLVAEITTRGFSVSTIKHAHHGVDVDQPGRDTYRHRVAGAQQVILSSAVRVAVMSELRGASEPGLSDLLTRLAPVDLVLVEGFKRESHHKIEAHRVETGQPLIALGDDSIQAVASNVLTDLAFDGRQFNLDDISAIADFVLAKVGL